MTCIKGINCSFADAIEQDRNNNPEVDMPEWARMVVTVGEVALAPLAMAGCATTSPVVVNEDGTNSADSSFLDSKELAEKEALKKADMFCAETISIPEVISVDTVSKVVPITRRECERDPLPYGVPSGGGKRPRPSALPPRCYNVFLYNATKWVSHITFKCVK